MQREIDDLRRQLKEATKSNASGAGRLVPDNAAEDQPQVGATSTRSRHLGDMELSGMTVDNIFKE